MRLYPEFFVILSKIFTQPDRFLPLNKLISTLTLLIIPATANHPRRDGRLTICFTTQHKALFWAFVLYVSYKLLAPAEHSGIDIAHLDKLVHAGIFFLLTLLLLRAYQMSRLQYLIVAGVYGLVTEYLQSQTAYRSADIFDWFADMAGVLILFATQNILRQIQAKISLKDGKSHD